MVNYTQSLLKAGTIKAADIIYRIEFRKAIKRASTTILPSGG
jgi:hypothetical protein